MGKRSEKRLEVLTEHMRNITGGRPLTGYALAKAWLWHWGSNHPKNKLDWYEIRITDKSIKAYGEVFQLANPNCFRELAMLLATKSSKRRRRK